MQTTAIGIRELHRSLPSITRAVNKGKSFVVMNHAKPIFNITPIKNTPKKTYTLADFAKLKFKHPNKNLSKEIDKYVYGI